MIQLEYTERGNVKSVPPTPFALSVTVIHPGFEGLAESTVEAWSATNRQGVVALVHHRALHGTFWTT